MKSIFSVQIDAGHDQRTSKGREIIIFCKIITFRKLHGIDFFQNFKLDTLTLVSRSLEELISCYNTELHTLWTNMPVSKLDL